MLLVRRNDRECLSSPVHKQHESMTSRTEGQHVLGEDGMRITVGVDDYRRCVNAAPEKGKWQAWLEEYYPRFRHVFDSVARYLYMADSVESLRPYVEACEFETCLETAERFLSLSGVERVKEILSRSARMLDFEEDCEAFLLVGFGHAEGATLPGDKPCLFFGLELLGDRMDRLAFTVSHEFMHSVRGREFSTGALTFGQLVIEEGIATAFSMVAQDLPLDNDSLRTALPFMTDEAFLYCEEHREALTREVLSHAASPLTAELAAKYLYSGSRLDERGVPGNAGYYVGTRMVVDLLRNGLSVKELVHLPVCTIIDAAMRRF